MKGKDTVSFDLDVTVTGVDEVTAKHAAADIIELCGMLIEEGGKSQDIVAGVLMAATLIASDVGDAHGPMH